MALLSAKKPGAHWSVDFVEHLRTVHFGMVTVAVALIILVYGSRDTRLSKALTQATQIVELQTRWSEVQKTLYTSAARHLNFPVEGRTYFVRVEAKTAALPSHLALLRMTLTPDFFGQYETWKFSGANMKDKPRNLAEFGTWWDKLHQGTTVVVPDLSKQKNETCNFNIWQQDEAGKIEDISLEDNRPFVAPGEQRQPPPYSCQEGWGLGDITELSTEIKEIELKPLGDDADMFFVDGWARKLNFGSVTKQKLTTGLHVEFTYQGKSISINESTLQELFSDWRTGAYADALSELVAVSKDLQTISLASVPARLEDLQPKGEQNIEAFGLKVPSADITRWGLVLLLAVQFYFWLHLHELNLKFDDAAPGLDVAWIGVYRSLVAAIAVLISACLLPTTAVLVLALRVPSDTQSHIPRWIPWAMAVAAILTSIGLAAVTGDLLYRLRQSRTTERIEEPSP